MKKNILNNSITNIVVNLLKMILDKNSNSSDIINFILLYNISPNIKLPTINNSNDEIPLLFYCCTNVNFKDLFLFLVENNVDVNCNMNCVDKDYNVDLLIYSQITYVPLLVKLGCKLTDKDINKNVTKLILYGNKDKLLTLLKYECIKKDDILLVINTPYIIFDILDILYEKVLKAKDNTTKHLYIDNYNVIFDICFKNNININQSRNNSSFMQNVLNTYFYKLIECCLKYNPDMTDVELYHYSNIPQNNRHNMSCFYTDENMNNIDKLIKPHIILKKIYIKKTHKTIEIVNST